MVSTIREVNRRDTMNDKGVIMDGDDAVNLYHKNRHMHH